ncbi:MAG: hypothetical protein JO163_16295 [Methylobacteriaceae bacterium]|nr:hypothetical protein [Methylobacteriaceae bacterium]
MRKSVAYLTAGVAISALVALGSPTTAKTSKECNTEYTANKAAIQASGQKKADFMSACKLGTETVPPAANAAPAPAPAAPPAAVPAAPAPAPTATAAASPGQYPTEAAAKTACGGELVVWVNTKSKVYHFAGTRDYGHTKQGAYMCEAQAQSAGDRAAKNEKHP